MLLPALDTNSNIDLFLFIPCEKLCTCAPCVHGDHLCKKSYSLNHKQWILHGQTVSDIDRRREYEKAFKAHLGFSYSNHSWPSIWSTSLWHFDGFIELLVQYRDQLVQYLALTFQSTQIYCFNLDQSSRGQKWTNLVTYPRLLNCHSSFFTFNSIQEAPFCGEIQDHKIALRTGYWGCCKRHYWFAYFPMVHFFTVYCSPINLVQRINHILVRQSPKSKLKPDSAAAACNDARNQFFRQIQVSVLHRWSKIVEARLEAVMPTHGEQRKLSSFGRAAGNCTLLIHLSQQSLNQGRLSNTVIGSAETKSETLV